LGEQIRYLVSHGSMYLIRDDHLIFHDTDFKGRALFDELGKVFARVIDGRTEQDLDILWYLWSGPRSPLFGKDRIATFERDFIADKTPHHEHKNPYFTLINEVEFCDKVLDEFGVDPKRGLIVNGHVPVKIEKGESPLKHSGKAITIDGPFSEAYGDYGYTLVLEADRTYLALHHQVDSVEAAIRDGVDIVPSVTNVRVFDKPQRTADTERGG
jgi:fructose-1,6-bisphosphatase III